MPLGALKPSRGNSKGRRRGYSDVPIDQDRKANAIKVGFTLVLAHRGRMAGRVPLSRRPCEYGTHPGGGFGRCRSQPILDAIEIALSTDRMQVADAIPGRRKLRDKPASIG